jgi:hypothetical protein
VPGPGAPLPSKELLDAVRDYLEPLRLLTVRQSVAAPVYAPVQAEIVVARRPDYPEAAVRESIAKELGRFLDPLVGGAGAGGAAGSAGGAGEGWPFGRDVYVSEIYQLLEKIPGVDYVPSVDLSSECPPASPRCVAAAGLWHDNGDFIGLGLRAHHLPWALIDPDSLFVGSASAFVPVEVRVTARAEAGTVAAEVRRRVKQAVLSLFHPLHEGPTGQADWQITELDVEGKVLGLPEVEAVTQVKIVADPRWLFQEGTDKGLRLKAGELAAAEAVLDGI